MFFVLSCMLGHCLVLACFTCLHFLVCFRIFLYVLVPLLFDFYVTPELHFAKQNATFECARNPELIGTSGKHEHTKNADGLLHAEPDGNRQIQLISSACEKILRGACATAHERGSRWAGAAAPRRGLDHACRLHAPLIVLALSRAAPQTLAAMPRPAPPLPAQLRPKGTRPAQRRLQKTSFGTPAWEAQSGHPN